MKTPLIQHETLLKETPANLQRGAETVGGRLYLTNHRLIFESHDFNLRRGTTVLSLPDIVGLEKCWTKFLNLIPIFPNSLAVKTVQGQDFRFVLFGRDGWIAAITQAQGAGSQLD